MKKTVLFVLVMSAWACLTHASAEVFNMKVSSLSKPLGIDNAHPCFSWQIRSSGRNFRQQSYQIVVTDTDGNEVWNTGPVVSAHQNNIEYAGESLESCTMYNWKIIIKGADGEIMENTSVFETAFMNPAEWTAEWITRDESRSCSFYEIKFDNPVNCRYLQLNITRLGLRASTDAGFSFVQLSEVEIYSGETNVARTAKFTSTNNWEPTANWRLAFINDGKVKDAGALGWTTVQNPSTPIVVTADLGNELTVDRIVLYPRQDDHAAGNEGKAANFPASFTIRTSQTGSNYTAQYIAEDVEAPEYRGSSTNVPYYGRNFMVRSAVKRARIYASALGVFTMKLNGRYVTDAKLEPGESEYEKSILYSTYDVTELLRHGDNTLLAQVAGGLFNVQTLKGRFSKGEIKNVGDMGLKAELHIEYEDGTADHIVTDGSWRWTESPVTGSNWWGGEDYDARKRVPGIDGETFDVGGWMPVRVIGNPKFASTQASGFGTLKSRMYEPLRVVEEWKAVNVKNV